MFLPPRVVKIIESLENSRAPFFYFLIAFIAAVLLRLFLEFFSSPFPWQPLILAHVLFFYASGGLGIALCLKLFLKIPTGKILRLISASFLFIVIAPLLDLLISHGQGLRMTYLLPQANPDLLKLFLTFGLSEPNLGITLGIKAEVFLGLAGILIYAYQKSRSWLKALLVFLVSYFWLFFLAVTPFVFQLLSSLFKTNASFSDRGSAMYFLALTLLLSLVLALVSYPRYAAILIKNSRWLRILAFILLAAVGFGLGAKEGVFIWSLENLFILFLSLWCLVAILAFAFLVNDWADKEGDYLANPSAFHQARRIPDNVYHLLIKVSLAAALVIGALISFSAFFLVALGLVITALYSLEPLRVKRVLLISKVLVALNALLVLMFGFVLSGAALSQFPGQIVLFFLIAVSLAANFIDLKDYSSDQQVGIKTLPVVLGLARAKLLVSLFFLLVYYWASRLFEGYLNYSWFLMIFGVLSFFFFNRKHYREKHLLAIFLLSLFFVLLFWQR